MTTIYRIFDTYHFGANAECYNIAFSSFFSLSCMDGALESRLFPLGRVLGVCEAEVRCNPRQCLLAAAVSLVET